MEKISLTPREATPVNVEIPAELIRGTEPNHRSMEKEKSSKGSLSMEWIGDIASAIPATAAVFNKDYQQSQVAIAEANARAAEAMAKEDEKKNQSKLLMYGGIAIAVILVLVFAFKN